MWDVLVAGAGPAGSVAAHELARHGLRVLLADSVSVGHKVGEALPGSAVRLLRTLLLPVPTPEGPHSPIGGNLSSWGSESLTPTDFLFDPDGQGWRLNRALFDQKLRDAAIGAGAAFRAVRVLATVRKSARWYVRLESGDTEPARWLIDATGRRAALARGLGARRARDAPLVAFYVLARPDAMCPLNRTLVEAVPRGWWYAGTLPSGAVLAGIHIRPTDAAQLNPLRGGLGPLLSETRHVSLLLRAEFTQPLRPLDACGARLDRFGGEGWIACGDAALSFDPISGQGILSALHGGWRAARAVIAVLGGDNAALGDYFFRLEEIRRIYRLNYRQIYSAETRWRGAPFWSTY